MSNSRGADTALGRAARWRALAGQPELRTDLVQVVKTVVAAVVAWVVAVRVLHLEQPFLAPWAALLTVHATVYRTFWRGAQSVAATFLGIVLSYVAVSLLGFGALSLALALLAGLLLARTPLIRTEGVTVATTALFVLTAGQGDQEVLLVDRFLDTLVGVGVGIVINILVVPPLDDRVAERALDRANRLLGGLLEQIAHDLRTDVSDAVSSGWIEESRRVDAVIDQAEQHLRFTSETHWANLRRHRSRHTTDVETAYVVLARLEEGVAQTRMIARVIHESVIEAHAWDEEFRERWTELLGQVGQRVADPAGEVADTRSTLDRLTRDMSGERLPDLHWPVYGSLITALLTIVAIVDDVASSSTGGLRPGHE